MSVSNCKYARHAFIYAMHAFIYSVHSCIHQTCHMQMPLPNIFGTRKKNPPSPAAPGAKPGGKKFRNKKKM